MTRSVYAAFTLEALDSTDREGTFYNVDLVAGSAIFQTAWLNGGVTDGIVILGIRTNSGNLGFIGYQNAIGPPPNDFNQQITSTNGSDTSGINVLILPLNNQHRGEPLTATGGIIQLHAVGGNPCFGTATLASGSVTIHTTNVSSSNLIFCCNATTSLIGPNTPDPVGNLWISNVVAAHSFTISSTEPTASNPVFWFVYNGPGITGPQTANANVILDDSNTTTRNYGKLTLTAGAASIVAPQLRSTSVVYVNTITPDTNAGNRGFMLVAPDSVNGRIDFWSTNGADTQTFAWWLFETAGGVS